MRCHLAALSTHVTKSFVDCWNVAIASSALASCRGNIRFNSRVTEALEQECTMTIDEFSTLQHDFTPEISIGKEFGVFSSSSSTTAPSEPIDLIDVVTCIAHETLQTDHHQINRRYSAGHIPT
jgi:hypothetical protein